jgi:hypothetical protein
MDLSLANPYLSTAQILNHGVPLQEKQHSIKPLKLPKTMRWHINIRAFTIQYFDVQISHVDFNKIGWMYRWVM